MASGGNGGLRGYTQWNVPIERDLEELRAAVESKLVSRGGHLLYLDRLEQPENNTSGRSEVTVGWWPDGSGMRIGKNAALMRLRYGGDIICVGARFVVAHKLGCDIANCVCDFHTYITTIGGNSRDRLAFTADQYALRFARERMYYEAIDPAIRAGKLILESYKGIGVGRDSVRNRGAVMIGSEHILPTDFLR